MLNNFEDIRDHMYLTFEQYTRQVKEGHIQNLSSDCIVYRVKDTPSIAKELYITKPLSIQGRHSTLYEMSDPRYLSKMIMNGSINESNVNCILLPLSYIPKVYEIYRTSQGGLLLLMERVQGVQLFTHMTDPQHNYTMDRDIIYKAIAQLQEIHDTKNVIHGDAHMNNFIYSGSRLYVIDFGLSFIVEDNGEQLGFLYQDFMSGNGSSFLYSSSNDGLYMNYDTDGINRQRQTYRIKKTIVGDIGLLVKVSRYCLDVFNLIIPTIPILFGGRAPIPSIDPYPILLQLREKIQFRMEETDINVLLTELLELFCFVKYLYESFIVAFNMILFPKEYSIPIQFNYEPELEQVMEDIDYNQVDYDLITTHMERTTGGGIYTEILPCLRGLNTDFRNQTPLDSFLFQLSVQLSQDYKFLYEDFLYKNKQIGKIFCDLVVGNDTKWNKKYISYKNPILLLMGIITTTPTGTFNEAEYKRIVQKEEENHIPITSKASVFRYHRYYLSIRG